MKKRIFLDLGVIPAIIAWLFMCFPGIVFGLASRENRSAAVMSGLLLLVSVLLLFPIPGSVISGSEQTR